LWFCRVTVLAVAFGCGRGETPPAGPAASSSPAGNGQVQTAPGGASQVIAHVRVVDLEGRPLPGMTPIATLQANAFDKPLAQGEPTQADGTSFLAMPTGQRMCVRALDPQVRLFANNYYELLPGEIMSDEALRIVMVPGASLDAVLLDPGNAPIAGANVGLMMFHPAEGPWWPAKADTDACGAVHFRSLPAGRYTLKIGTAGGGQIEIPEVLLLPGRAKDLGPIVLQ
jgi:hypothetical protein